MVGIRKTYTCFSCLQESTDSVNCSYCGSKIEFVDFSNAVFYPPIAGCVEIESNSPIVHEIVFAVTKRLEALYHDHFRFLEVEEGIRVECNDISGARLVSCLAEELANLHVGAPVRFMKLGNGN